MGLPLLIYIRADGGDVDDVGTPHDYMTCAPARKKSANCRADINEYARRNGGQDIRYAECAFYFFRKVMTPAIMMTSIKAMTRHMKCTIEMRMDISIPKMMSTALVVCTWGAPGYFI